MSDPQHEQPEDEGVRVTDRRRIDPQTGEVRAPAGAAAAGEPPAADAADEVLADAAAEGVLADAEAIVDDEAVSLAQARVDELTSDLQRLAAEYKNYRDRVQREIAEARLRGRADVVSELIASLDDLDRAAEHGDLSGPVKALAGNLNGTLAKLGVERYGTVGEPFDPVVHEAMTHAEGEGFEGPTVTAVYQPGYRMGDRVIRAARVAVTE